MSPDDDLEARLHEKWGAGEFDKVATLVLDRYGREILSFLVARLRSRSDGDEVFSMFCEDLWKGLPTFGWRCSMRGWCYTLARNAANRYAVDPRQRAKLHQTLSGRSNLSNLIDRVRTGTHQYLKTEVKDQMTQLREQLPLEDQTVLMLRVDRELSWRDLTQVMAESELSESDLKKEEARLRKRFSLAKGRLKEMAREAGMI